MKRTFVWVFVFQLLLCLLSVPFPNPLGPHWGAQAYGYPFPWLLDTWEFQSKDQMYPPGFHAAWSMIAVNLFIILSITTVVSVVSGIVGQTVEVTRKLYAKPQKTAASAQDFPR